MEPGQALDERNLVYWQFQDQTQPGFVRRVLHLLVIVSEASSVQVYHNVSYTSQYVLRPLRKEVNRHPSLAGDVGFIELRRVDLGLTRREGMMVRRQEWRESGCQPHQRLCHA